MSVTEVAGLNREFFSGNGATTVFNFTQRHLSTTNIKAYVSGVEVLTITVAKDTDGLGGTVTFATAPATGTDNVLIMGIEPLDQATGYDPLSTFSEDDMEISLDRLTLICRQLKEAVQRALKFPITSSQVDITLPEPDAGKTLVWNDDEDGFDNSTRNLDDIVDDAEAAEAAAEAAQAAAETAETNAETAEVAAEAALAATVALAPSVSGTRAAPNDLVAGTAFIPGSHYMQTAFIQGSGGAVTVSANPQIAAGTVLGQVLKLVGRSDANTVTYANGNGLSLNGDITLEEDNVLEVEWDGTNWRENNRSH